MKILKPTSLAALLLLVGTAVGAQTEQPKKTGLGHMEGPRDMNIVQVEPSVINERYYTRGDAERHQYIGNVLPAGAPIPDVEEPLSKQVNKTKSDGKGSGGKAEIKGRSDAETDKATATEHKTEGNSPASSASTKTSAKIKGKKKADIFDRHQFVGNTLPAGAPIPDNE